MYFSDEITLVKRTYTGSTANETARTAFCDISSVTGTEDANARQNSIKPSARAAVHAEDYAGETIVQYIGSPQLAAGRYTVYRTYFKGDTVELYLTMKKGEQHG
ncbi:MAG: hypothetical protein E7572_05515 [Ruminococcaceae bacterium]|nr:hypothetical protein [Oscillospiraceae bacterium]